MNAEPLYGQLGLSEHEIRQTIAEELELAAASERALTAHAIAHSVARVLDQDHARIAEQLEQAGIRLRRNNM